MAAIKKVFSNGNRQLLTCDLICHSVSSPLLFSEHIKAIESSTGKRIKDYRFRDKYIGWNYNMHRIVYKDGSIARHSYWTQCFKRLFFLNLIARESCYHCPYSSLSRIGDISLGDYWGIDKVSCKFADNRGVNVVFFNTELAVSFMNTIKERCLWIETDLKEALQKHLVMPCEKTEKVDAFWECYARSSYSKACDRFAGQRYYITIRNFLKDWLVKNRLIHI